MNSTMNKDTFLVKRYRLRSGKLAGPARAVFLTDLHCSSFGENNCMLLERCAELRPDLILSSGDMIIDKAETDFDGVLQLFSELSRLAPTYLVNGNHESKLRKFPAVYHEYISKLRHSGIFLMNNRTELFVHGRDRIRISGLELPLRTYRKLRKPSFSCEEIEERIGQSVTGEKEYRILLCHNPVFAERYVEWGADLSLCGHFHGGVMRLKGNLVALSPYGTPLPRYGYGAFCKGEQAVIVSSGLGDHAIPVRIRNPKELVALDLLPLY